MDRFAPSHLIALAVTAVAAVALGWWARRHRPDDLRLRYARRTLAMAMVAAEVGLRVAVYALDGVRSGANLPLHLTHFAWLACVIALWTAAPLAFELAYFWGAAAVTQALLTPSLNHDFPDVRYWEFMVIHAPVIVGITLMAWGCRMTPRRGAVMRAWLASWGAFAVAATASALTGGNYMFARNPPPKGSLLDLMGPWPHYLAGSALLALVTFWLLNLPFHRRRHKSDRAQSARAT